MQIWLRASESDFESTIFATPCATTCVYEFGGLFRASLQSSSFGNHAHTIINHCYRFGHPKSKRRCRDRGGTGRFVDLERENREEHRELPRAQQTEQCFSSIVT